MTGWAGSKATYLRSHWPWAVLVGAGWLAAVLLFWGANRRELPPCRSLGFFEARDAIGDLFLWATLSAGVAATASLLGTLFCRGFRAVFLLVLFISLVLAGCCFIAAVGTGLSCAFD